MFSIDILKDDQMNEKRYCSHSVTSLGQATLLSGHPVVTNISKWCHSHNQPRRGVKPTLAVVYFDTGEDAEEYLYVKAVIAARVLTTCTLESISTDCRYQAGIAYTTHKLHPKAPLNSVLSLIASLNRNESTHGILIQRPIPSHLPESKVMNSISPEKHIEEFTHGNPNNIALEALERLLANYQKSGLLDLHTILLGGTNIITRAFVKQLALRHGKSTTLSNVPEDISTHRQDTILITELNHDSVITPEMLGSRVKLVVDLGFDVETKQGDLDPDVLDIEGLTVVPTPGGVLPVLLWVMMERTIRARERMENADTGVAGCCAVS